MFLIKRLVHLVFVVYFRSCCHFFIIWIRSSFLISGAIFSPDMVHLISFSESTKIAALTEIVLYPLTTSRDVVLCREINFSLDLQAFSSIEAPYKTIGCVVAQIALLLLSVGLFILGLCSF